MTADENLLAALSGPPGAPSAPAGWRPQRVIGSESFELTTTAREVPDGNASPISAEEQAELLRAHDMDPQQWVVTGFSSSRWQTFSGSWLEASKIHGRPRVAAALFGQDMPDLDDIDRAVARITRTAPPSTFGLNPELTNVGVLADLQVGKALADDTPVLTTEGWKKHGEIRPGDRVFGADGLPKRVLSVTGSSLQDVYDVEFDQGVVLQATAQHLWAGQRILKKRGGHDYAGYEVYEVTLTTAELAALPTVKTRAGSTVFQHPLSVAMTEVEMPEADLPIDPYILGFWLGDGYAYSGNIAAGVEDSEYLLALPGAHAVPSLCERGMFGVNIEGLKTQLRLLGLIANKHVPEVYLHASIAQRAALLQGLMDSDGHCGLNGTAEFSNTNFRLTDAVEWLLTSLGYKYRTWERTGRLNGEAKKPYRRIRFRPTAGTFRLARKASRVREDLRTEARRRFVRSVTPAGQASAQCLTVEGGLYLAGRDLVVTHNSNHRGGVEELLARVDESLEAWTDQILLQRPAEIVLLDAGDPIENFESAGEQERTNDLGLTEQIRVWRRIFWKWVERAASLAPTVHVAAVGSNHGRVRRGKAALGHASEDYGIEVLAQLSDMAAVNPDKYGHVRFYTPGKFDESLALHLAGGKVLGMVHGHQVQRATALDAWWAKQSHGRGPVADADILVAGHFHAFHVLPSGGDRWIFVAPTSDNGSAWFRNISGKENPPGVLSFAVDPLGWRGLALV